MDSPHPSYDHLLASPPTGCPALPPHRGPRRDLRLRGRPVRLPPQAWVFVDHLKAAYA